METAEAANSLWCLELELELSLLPAGRALEAGEKHLTMVLRALDEAGILPAALHPVMSSFDQFGSQGWEALERVLAPWRGRLPILMPARFGESARVGAQAATTVYDTWGADAAILTPWVGHEFLQPFLARLPERGSLFVVRCPGKPGAYDLAGTPVDEPGGRRPLWMTVARGLRGSMRRGVGAVVGSQSLGELAHVASTLTGEVPKALLVLGVNSPSADVGGIAEALRLSCEETRAFRVGVGLPILYAQPSSPGDDPVSAAVMAARRVHTLLNLHHPQSGAPAEPIRVFLVEDHGLVRRAFRSVLEHERDITVVGEVTTAEEALDSVQEARPDVVLLDLGLPGMSGLDATRRLRSLGCPARILVLSASEDIEDVTSSLAAGAHGYMHKRIHAEELIDSVRRAFRGEPVIPRDMVAPYLEHQARERRGATHLSEREQEVLVLLAEGCKNREIAGRLATAEGTIKTHVRNLYRKLGIGTRREAVVSARNLGLI